MKSVNNFLILNVVAIAVTGIATLLYSGYGLGLPATQPMAEAFRQLTTAAWTQFEAHRIVGETKQWYGIAILFTSIFVTLTTATLMRAGRFSPQSIGDWMPYIIWLPVTGAVAALGATMLIPYLIDPSALLAMSHVELSHFTNLVATAHGFFQETGGAVGSQWNWWLYAGVAAALNLPGIVLAAIGFQRKQQTKQREEGITLVVVRPS